MQNWIKAAVIAVSLALPGVALAQSLESLVNVQGVRENQLVGYSLVVGLDGTGDKNQVKFTNQTITNMLRQFGVQLPNKIDPKVKNVAAVAVSATLPPMYSRGQTIDVTVSSIGDAKSIRGGTLLLTQLHGADGEVYALAQGSVVVGGMNATGASGSSVTVNTPTAGLIPNGATVEREIPSDFQMGDTITLNLKRRRLKTPTTLRRRSTPRLAVLPPRRVPPTLPCARPPAPARGWHLCRNWTMCRCRRRKSALAWCLTRVPARW